jgi:lipopolysaccharide export system permease protein
VLKKLDILVIKAFIGPFIATFFITLMVLVMQFFWLWVDDFVGKGVPINVLLTFIWYQSAVLVPLALPLAVLLSSIMTFGNLGETYELVAIKSAGLSLLRFMRPLLFITILICGIAFTFSNYVIPVALLKSRTLQGDIVSSKPSFDLKEGVFYDKIPRFTIKVGKKENDSIIRDVIIYEESNGVQDNFIIASSGVMRASESKRYLELTLKDGWRYEERGTAPNTEYIRLGFKEYTRQFDISSLGLQRRNNEEDMKGNFRMFNMRQLNVAIDSLRKFNAGAYLRVRRDVLGSFPYAAYVDSSWKTAPKTDTIKRFDQLVPDSLKSTIRLRVLNKLANMQMTNEVAITDVKAQQKILRQHQIEWHRKLSLSIACLVLFLIGAPLGSIIRKGGLGSPLVFAIVFFMVFYFTSNTGEKAAKEGTMNPIVGMWLSTMLLTPIGLFLTYKAMRDSHLFNKEFYYRFWKKLRSKRKA